MPVEYERTDDPDIFLEIKTQIKELSIVRLESQKAQLDEEIAEHEDEVPTTDVTPEQKVAIDFYNMQTQDMISNVVQERDRVQGLITTLKALPQAVK